MSETGSALRATSDALLRDLERLGELEQRKREMSPDDERLVEVAAEVESIALRVLGGTIRQRELTERERDLVSDGSPDAPADSIARTPREIHVILAEWRDAERRATESAAGSPEAAAAELEIDRLRSEYRHAHEDALRRRS
ncbi:MAG TPA: hypothetical protein VKA85_04965 [Candidatus Limnocylindrales bacterium]|nr:hypothetical protein [Candidatus Limnocylindrales bacterium]